MKTKKLFFSAIALTVAVSLTFTGCRKKEEKDDDTSGASDNALAESNFNDMGQISDEASKGGMSNYKIVDYDGILSTCATLTFDTLNHIDADSVIVDFGPTNCLCKDNRYRRGKFYIMWTAGKHYWDSLASITQTTSPTDNYFVNDNQVKGTRNITNNGHNAAHHMNWSISVNGTIIKANNQGTVTWTSNRNREWITGENTPLIWSDNVFSITGSASGTSANGTPFTGTITGALIKQVTCHWFSGGTFDFTPGSKPTRHVDFSPPNNGACDNIATVTINSNVFTIHLH